MTTVDPRWSLDYMMHAFRPHASWRVWFNEAFERAMLSTLPKERLQGWHTAAIILGDMGATVMCLFACLHGTSLLEDSGGEGFQAHVDLCLLDMGLAVPAAHAEKRSVPLVDFGMPEKFRRDTDTFDAWMSEQLRPFGGDTRLAAEFAMRLTAIRLGLLTGPNDPSIEQVLDVSLWTRVEPARENPAKPANPPNPAPASPRGKRWWQLWK